jgi:hypothetical protein
LIVIWVASTIFPEYAAEGNTTHGSFNRRESLQNIPFIEIVQSQQHKTCQTFKPFLLFLGKNFSALFSLPHIATTQLLQEPINVYGLYRTVGRGKGVSPKCG